MPRSNDPAGTRRPPNGERGNAIVESIGVLVVLVLPAIVAALALAAAFSAKSAAGSAARDAARAYVRATSSSEGRERATALARLAFADRGIHAEPPLAFACTRDPCLSPGGHVDVVMTVDVALPIVDAPVEVTEKRRFAVDALRRTRR